MQGMEPASRKDCMTQGAKAAGEGGSLSSNPYHNGSAEYDAWRAGWFRYVNIQQNSREPACA